jgi:hypothetical protein
MLEAILIIVTLGGLEFLLWHIERKRQIRIEIEDVVQQGRQLEVLDGILTELAIMNSTDTQETAPTSKEII